MGHAPHWYTAGTRGVLAPVHSPGATDLTIGHGLKFSG
jgi:hypothetical protein